MRFRKFLKPYKTRGSSFREHTYYQEGGSGTQREAAETGIAVEFWNTNFIKASLQRHR